MSSGKYLGVKIISAEPAQAEESDKRSKYPIGADGYRITYEDGYISWSPKEVFDAAYRRIDSLTFGLAVEAMKLGKRVARAGWNGKGMWLELIKGKEIQIHNHGFGPKNEFDHDWRDRCPEFASWIGMKTADNKFVPWLASQTDVLAEDWAMLE